MSDRQEPDISSWSYAIRDLNDLVLDSYEKGRRPSALWVDEWLYDVYVRGLHIDQILEHNKVLSDLGLKNAMFGGVWIVRREDG